LDHEHAEGRDLAFLYSDLHPLFYRRLGFVELPSRRYAARASSFASARIKAAPIEARDWPDVRRCFERLERRRAWSFTRPAIVWTWLRTKWEASPPPSAQNVWLASRDPRKVVAYVLGQRDPLKDTFFLDEFAFADDEGRRRIPALVRAAAGDLRRVRGWLPPEPARRAIPRGSVRDRKSPIFMVAPLSQTAAEWLRANRETIARSPGDPIWLADHV
jgi:hypothetical protein